MNYPIHGISDKELLIDWLDSDEYSSDPDQELIELKEDIEILFNYRRIQGIQE